MFLNIINGLNEKKRICFVQFPPQLKVSLLDIISEFSFYKDIKGFEVSIEGH